MWTDHHAGATGYADVRDGTGMLWRYIQGESTRKALIMCPGDFGENLVNHPVDPNFPQDSNNPGAERGRSNFDVRHRMSVSYSYALPFGKGRAWLSKGGAAAAMGG